MPVFGFGEQLEKEKLGVEVAIKVFSRLGRVTDVRYLEAMRPYGDIQCQKDGKVRNTEVKTDHTDYPNFFLETVSVVEKNIPGWIINSRSDYLFYYFSKRNEWYIFNTKKIIKWFEENQHNYQEKTVTTVDGDRRWHTKGKPVPIRTLIEAGMIEAKNV